MAEKSALDAEGLLEKIFSYINELVDEKEFSTTIRILTDLGRTLVNSDRASFWFWDKRKKQHWTIVALDNDKITVPEGTGIVGTAIVKNKTLVMNDPYEDTRFNSEVDKETGYVTKSILCMPVTDSHGCVIGAYQAVNKLDADGNPADFDETDQKHLALAAVYCGKTLESYLLNSDTHMDPVTKLRNQKGFYEYYNKRVLPYLINHDVSMIMGDVDFFSIKNDIYSTSGGDEVLRSIADIIIYNLGIEDEVVRWDKDRFLIILTDEGLEEACNVAEKIREAVESCDCLYNENSIKSTMSFGVIQLSYEKTSDENIHEVEDKLEQAKRSGRNIVIS